MPMPKREIRYRGYLLRYDPPPIPDRRNDWGAHVEDDPESEPMLFAPGPLSLMLAIDERLEDQEPENHFP